MTALWAVLGLALAAEWRAGGGAQLETAGHGLADLGYRSGGWSAELYTETLDLRYERSFSRGKVVVGGRAGAFGGGMWLTPWTAGAPDLDRIQFCTSAGPDLTAQRWLGGGAFLGATVSSRGQWFTPGERATLRVDNVWWTRADAGFGWWVDDGRRTFWAAGGVDWTEAFAGGSRLSPHAFAQGTWTVDADVAPVVEARAGWAANADDVVATRLGGMTPYHVPLAGAAWAEFWVEDYAALRLGAASRFGAFTVPVFLDTAVWTLPAATTSPDPTDGWAMGLLTGLRWNRDTWFVQGDVGWSPTLDRQPGVWPVALFFHVGTAWRPWKATAPDAPSDG